jgi:hypothetical protein
MQGLGVLADVVTRLEREGMRYVLTGSVATNCYVAQRTTVDIDLVIQLERPDVRRVVGLFEADYYLDEAAVDEAIRLRRSFNIIHYEQLIKLDFIVVAPSELQEARFARRRRLVVDNVAVWVLSPEDLILAKLEWARTSRSERQLGDVRNLLTEVPDLDHHYLDTAASQLGLTELLHEAQA